MKHCPFCHRDLELEDFPSSPIHADGRSPRCNDCQTGGPPKQAPGQAQQPHQQPFRDSAPPSNPWVEARRRAYQERQRRHSNTKKGRPEAVRARKMVARAVANGTLTPQDCQYGFKGCILRPTEAHHTSYEPGQELNVTWVCKPCHDTLTTRIVRKRKAKEAKPPP